MHRRLQALFRRSPPQKETKAIASSKDESQPPPYTSSQNTVRTNGQILVINRSPETRDKIISIVEKATAHAEKELRNVLIDDDAVRIVRGIINEGCYSAANAVFAVPNRIPFFGSWDRDLRHERSKVNEAVLSAALAVPRWNHQPAIFTAQAIAKVLDEVALLRHEWIGCTRVPNQCIGCHARG